MFRRSRRHLQGAHQRYKNFGVLPIGTTGPGQNRRMIFKWFLQKKCMRVQPGFSRLRMGWGGGFEEPVMNRRVICRVENFLNSRATVSF
jgi:hypothetical protein